MGKLVTEGLAQRQGQIQDLLGQLAYKRLQLVRQIEDMDRDLLRLAGGLEATQFALADVTTESLEAKKEEAKQNGS